MKALSAIRIAALSFFAAAPVAQGAAPQDAAPPKAQWEALRVLKPWTGDLDGMVRRQTIRALVVYSKTFYFVDEGRQYGLSYEGLKIFERELNRKPKVDRAKVRIIFLPVSRDDLIPALLEGRGDIAVANLTITPERQRQVDFSVPVLTNVSELVVTGPRSPRIASVDDLSGEKVLVRKSSSYYEHLERLNERFRKEGNPPARLRLASEHLEDEDLMEMVNAGLVGLIVVDRHKAEFWQQVFKDIALHPEAAVNTGGEIAWMFRKDSPKLKAAVDEIVRTRAAGTLLGNELIRRYLKSTRLVLNATSEDEIEKYHRMVSLFKKYGDKYDMDHLLMMAQGYQESRLDQEVRSGVGAIGVMQLMPATGELMQVGDITRLEPNIHAGVKYMRTLIDQYFPSEPKDRLNRGLFALASYNAGPSRILQLRQEAAKRNAAGRAKDS
ncbi:MAG TPA: lytic transglycosylase F [Burkholderiales bacterium]|nr:lytic transglycosylase F [Burkholderiales bacterium]